MKLHSSAILKILQIYQNHGGFDSDRRLREHLEKLDFVAYERKTSNEQGSVLVLTEDYLKELTKKK
jgi:hypothetical protein